MMGQSVSPAIRMMVTKINAVGIGNIKRYVKSKHPRVNFDKHLAMLRDIAKVGYAEVTVKYNCSRQYAEQVPKQYYNYALEVEKNNEHS